MTEQVAVVTGANGFIASYIVKQLLEEKVKVIGTVRSFDRATNLKRKFPSQISTGQLTFIEADLNNNESLARIFQKYHNITRFIHPAQNFAWMANTPEELDREIIKHTEKSLDFIINLVENSDSPIERFVFFSTSVAVRGPEVVDYSKVYTENDYAQVTYSEALTSWKKAYTFAKVQGEKKLLSLKSKRNIEYKVLVPPVVMGPPLCLWNSPGQIEPNNKNLYAVFEGKYPARDVEWYADVRNVADAAVQASDKTQTPGTTNNRYVIVDGTNNFYDAILIFLKHFKAENPQVWDELSKEGKEADKNRTPAKRDFSITESEINHKEIPFEKTVLDTISCFRELKRKYASDSSELK